MDTRLQRILIRQHIPTLRRTSLRMSSRHTVTAAESVSVLDIITMVVTADTMAVIAGIMADTTVDMADTTVATADTTVATADTTVATAGITVAMVDITDSVEMNRLCHLVGLGRFNLPSLPR